MDTLIAILQEPFTWGLLLGLLVAGFIFKNAVIAKRTAKKQARALADEVQQLKTHLHRQMEINARGQTDLDSELASLRTQNETLRMRVHELQQKPERQTARRLETYELTLRTLREQAPGFSTAWENALRAAEESIDSHDRGIRQMLSRVIPRLKGSSSSPGAAPPLG